MEKGQARLHRSQPKMRGCGAWVFWSRGPKSGPQREGELGVEEGVQHFGGGGGQRPRKISERSEEESCRQGAPPPESPLP